MFCNAIDLHPVTKDTKVCDTFILDVTEQESSDRKKSVIAGHSDTNL